MLKQQFNEITFTKLTYAQERAKLNKYLIGNCSKKRFRTIEIDPCSFSFFFSEDLKIEIYWRFYYNNSQREFDSRFSFFFFSRTSSIMRTSCKCGTSVNYPRHNQNWNCFMTNRAYQLCTTSFLFRNKQLNISLDIIVGGFYLMHNAVWCLVIKQGLLWGFSMLSLFLTKLSRLGTDYWCCGNVFDISKQFPVYIKKQNHFDCK